MPSARSFALVLLTVAAAGLAISFVSSGGGLSLIPEYSFPGGAEPAAQRVGGRDLRPAAFDRLWTVGGEDEPHLFGSFRLKADSQGSLFVADYGDLGVKELTADGDYLRTYGMGRGQGPGELGTITDYFVERQGELWIADNSNGRILVFDRGGELQRTLRLSQQPYRLLVRSPDDLLLMQPFAKELLFARVTAGGQPLAEFGRMLTDQRRSSLVLDGLIEGDGRDGFVYAGHYASLLAAYSMQGELRWVVKSVDPTPLPKLIQNDKGMIWVDRGARGNAWSLSVVGDEVHVLSSMPDGLRRAVVLDTYRLDDGAYLYSRRLPERCRWATVTAQHLYTVTDSTISKWRPAGGDAVEPRL